MNLVKKALLLLLLCPLLALGGCGSPDAVKVTEGHWTLAIPKAWQETAPSGERWQKAFQGEGGVRLEIAGLLSEEFSARGALGNLNFPAMQQLPDFESQSIEEVKVKGEAYEVVIQRYTFTEDGRPRAGAWIVGTQWPYPQSAAISISSDSGELDEQLVSQILESLKWNKTT